MKPVNRTVYLGLRHGHNPPWYLSIEDSVRRDVQLPFHRKLRVRTSPHAAPFILPVGRRPSGPHETLVPIRIRKNNQGIVLGPIIGILTVRRKSTGSFRGNRANYSDIIRMGRRLGLTVVVFTPEGIRDDDKIDAYILTSEGRPVWKRMLLPLPSVVYNRVPDREAEAEGSVVRAKRWLAERRIPFFNGGFFDKQQLAEWLAGSEQTACYLPVTEGLRDVQQMMRLMRLYPLLYVKPVDGKAGDGIFQIRRAAKGCQVTYQQGGKRTRASFATHREAANAIWRRMRGRTYLIQQGIPLASFAGRRFDLRMLLQKNRYGHWRVTGIGARVADSDGITTHVPNGGQIEKALTALRAAFGADRALAIWRKARMMGLLVAERIEHEVHSRRQLLGELSLDIGVDTEGGLWFFEANAKPMKFDEPYIRARSLLRLLHYCEFLARTR